ncbi:MAG: UDP-N-acetylglucosamine 2-epimerase [Nitrosarchaeum sp.]|nr:UDP-N-acetylglucosamine 2-epimerase [Nitrosarchaeum sp.]
MSDFKKIVILADSLSSIDVIQEYLKENPVIITFDYSTHKLLTANSIDHEISDDYLDQNEPRQLQKKSLEFSDWFNQEPIKNSLEYNGVNLGALFFVEFHYFLVPFIKKIVEIIRVFEKYKDATFLATPSLIKMISTITNSATQIGNKVENTLLYDQVKVSLSKSITINLKRDHYLKLKKIFEKVLDLFFGISEKSEFKKTVLFVEFDTLRYQNLFSNLPKYSLNGVFYGRRHPAFWNWKTYSIIRKSKCKVVTEEKFLGKEINQKIENNISSINSKINKFWDQEEFFKSFFSFQDISFWPIIKSTFVELCKKRMSEAITEIELTIKLFEKVKFTSVLLWSENGFNEQIVLNVATQFKIPVILLQHGLYRETKEAYEFNKFSGVVPIQSKKFISWGEATKNYFMQCGIEESKIHVVGSPIYDDFFEQSKQLERKNDYILLATSSPTNNIISDLTVKTREKYEHFIQKICKTVVAANEKLVIKLHPFQDELDITNITEKISPNILVIKHGNFASLVRSCKFLIVIDLSTTILEAQIFDKPTLSVSIKDYYLGEPELFKNNSCATADIDSFEKTFQIILKDNDYRNQIIKNGNKFMSEYVSNQGAASKKLLELLEKE